MRVRRSALAVAATFSIFAALPAMPSLGGGSSPWTRLSPQNSDTIVQSSLHRTGDGHLHVLWPRKDGTDRDLMHTRIGPNGEPNNTNQVLNSWDILSGYEVLPASGGGMDAYISGQEGDVSGIGVATSTQSGASWAVPGDEIEGGGQTHASTVGGTTDASGTPFASWSGVSVLRGTSDANSAFAYGHDGCCEYDPDMAFNGGNDDLWVAWYSNVTNKSGIWAQQVEPSNGAPLGPKLKMPGVASGGDAIQHVVLRTPITGRGGDRGGVYIAHTGGYPTAKKVLVWRIGNESSKVLAESPAGKENPTIAADPSGRIWVLWSREDGNDRSFIYARRSNDTVTAWGPTIKLRGPNGADSVYDLSASARSDRVDVVALMHTNGGTAFWHAQIKP